MKGIRLGLFAILIASFLTAFAQSARHESVNATIAAADKAVDTSKAKLDHFDASTVDKSLSHCDDFYKFVCSKWEAENPMPSDEVFWGTSSGLQIWNENILRETLQDAADKKGARTPIEQKIGDYWAACTDEAGIESAGIRDLKPELDRIAAMKSKADLAAEVAHLHMTLPDAWDMDDNQTESPILGFGSRQDLDNASMVVAGIDQAGMALPGRDFYLKDDDASAAIRKYYVQHVSKMLALSGETQEQADDHAQVIIAMETALAKSAMDNVKRRDPKNLNNKMNLQEVEALTPSFQWTTYLKIVGAPTPDHYLVSSPNFFPCLEQLIQQRSLDDWKEYLRWQVVHGSAPFLSKAFADENFRFFATRLFGAKEQLPRWRRCVHAADRDLGDAVGQAYVARAFPPSAKERTVALVDSVEQSLGDDIKTLDWMSPQTKEQAQIKLHDIEDKVGYPNKWRDYASVTITRNSYLNNVHSATAYEFHRNLIKIGKPVDRAEWTMTPPTINAYYDSQLNTINFPAGILQPPMFDNAKDDSVNYGGIGAVIGHEITHGFDDQGRKFDAKGNLHDWWTESDAKAYDERGKCIVDQYTQEVPEAGVKQDGHLTQGEDTADNGGIRIAFMAFQKKLKAAGKSLDEKGPDGFTPRQRFFLSYAFTWCTEVRPETTRTIVMTDPHSMPKYRVNNVVADFPEFGEAFACKAGSPMVRANACRVW